MKIKQAIAQRLGLTSTRDIDVLSKFFATSNKARKPVTLETSMSIAAVYRAVRLNSETTAALPLPFYQKTLNGPKLATGSSTESLLRVSPNADQTPIEFLEQLIACQDLLGEGIALKHWNDARTRVVAITILDPRKCEDVDNAAETDWFWRYTDPRGYRHDFDRSDILHLPGFSMMGRRGVSGMRVARETLGLALAANEAASSIFATGMRNSGFLKTGKVLEEKDRERLEKILQSYMGSSKAGGLMILEAGMDFTALNMSAEDAQLLVTRKFEIEEIGRWFGVPPILLGHAVDGQTMWGSGVESIIQSWLTFGLSQRLRRTESAIMKRLMLPNEIGAGLYPRFNADALLALNTTGRINVLSQSVQNSLMTPDEARDRLELPAQPGGDKLLAQVNLVPLANLGDNGSSEQQAKAALRSWLGIEVKPNEKLDA